jgi:phosphopantothenoylcysteine decarboxylase/phosphopantothenate--cysteine ligase
VRVQTAGEMRVAVMERLADVTMVIKAAAVADFRVREVAAGKLERGGALTLELEATEDIVRGVVEQRRAGTMVVAFAAEVGMDVQRAQEKMLRKGVDAIVVNDISGAGVGFDSERNAAVFLTRDAAAEVAEASKRDVAERILDEMVAMRARAWAAMYAS